MGKSAVVDAPAAGQTPSAVPSVPPPPMGKESSEGEEEDDEEEEEEEEEDVDVTMKDGSESEGS